MGFLRRVRQRFARTPLRRSLVRYRHRQVRPGDVMIAAYPRSGSTWLRFLLYGLLSGESATFGAVNAGIPDVGRGRPAVLLPGGGRLIKTHEPYDDAYRRALYLVRDVRSVAISEYHYQRMVGRFDGDLDAFLRDFLAGSVNPYGAWQSHVASWLESPPAEAGDVLVIRFEDLKSDTEAVLSRIVRVLGGDAVRVRIEEVVRDNSVSRMREKEVAAGERSVSKTRDDERFVRKGEAGEWRERMTQSQIATLESACGPTLERLGYELDVSRGG